MSRSFSSVWTETGMLRIRWWLPMAFTTLTVGYLGLNMLTLVMIVGGAQGHFDPVLNAPISWLFNR